MRISGTQPPAHVGGAACGAPRRGRPGCAGVGSRLGATQRKCAHRVMHWGRHTAIAHSLRQPAECQHQACQRTRTGVTGRPLRSLPSPSAHWSPLSSTASGWLGSYNGGAAASCAPAAPPPAPAVPRLPSTGRPAPSAGLRGMASASDLGAAAIGAAGVSDTKHTPRLVCWRVAIIAVGVAAALHTRVWRLHAGYRSRQSAWPARCCIPGTRLTTLLPRSPHRKSSYSRA